MKGVIVLSMPSGSSTDRRRWTLLNESDYLFAHLSYEGPPIQPGERVKVVEAQLAEQLAEASKGYLDAKGLLASSSGRQTEAQAERALRAALASYERTEGGEVDG